VKISAIVMAAAVAGLFSAGSAFASTQVAAAGGPPVKVLNFQYSYASPDDEVGLPQEGLMLTFENVSSQAAKSVVFAVRDASGFQLGTVTRHGTFSPGVDITRYFGEVKMKHKHGDPAKANVIEVTFADGTQWDAKK
jgi:uncharacterized cupredoxin-like copper-binding protein